MVARTAAVHSLVVVAWALAGCRFHFDALDDAGTHDGDGPTVDTPPLDLTCNMTVKLAAIPTGNASLLSAAATVSGLAATWLTANSTVGGISVRITGTTSEVVRTRDNLFNDAIGTRTIASLAGKADNLLVAARTPSGTTIAQRFDVGLAGPMGTAASSPELDNLRGLAALPGTPDYAIAAPSGSGTQVARFRVGATAESDKQVLGEGYPEHNLFAIGDRVMLVGSNAGQCQARPVDVVGGTFGAVQNWGPAGQCTVGRAASAGGGEVGLLRINGSAVVLSTASLTGNALVVRPEASPTYSTELAPRFAATTSAYWMTRVQGGQVIYDQFTQAGTEIATALPLDTPVPPRALELVVLGDTPYALWIGEGVYMARLCP